MTTGIQQTFDERARLVNQMTEITVSAAKEGRALTNEECLKFDKIEADEAALTRTIEAYKRTEALVAERAKADNLKAVDASGRSWTQNSTDEIAEKNENYARAFTKYFTRGMGALTHDERTMLDENRGTSTQVVGTTTLGGFTVPTLLMDGIERSMLDYSGIFQAATFADSIERTAKGGPQTYVTEDDTATSAVLIAEAAAYTVQDLTVALITLNAYDYGTSAKISYQLLRDSNFDMAKELKNTFGARFGRALNTSCTTGTGSSQPNGVMTASTLGKTATSATAFTFNEVIDLKHSVDPAYRASPAFGFMIHDTTLAFMKKLTNGTADARPLWMPSAREGAPDLIDGSRYWINQGLSSTYTTGQKLILAGDFSKYKIRLVSEMNVQRLDELYAANGLVGFQGTMSWDGELMNTAAIKHLKLA